MENSSMGENFIIKVRFHYVRELHTFSTTMWYCIVKSIVQTCSNMCENHESWYVDHINALDMEIRTTKSINQFGLDAKDVCWHRIPFNQFLTEINFVFKIYQSFNGDFFKWNSFSGQCFLYIVNVIREDCADRLDCFAKRSTWRR